MKIERLDIHMADIKPEDIKFDTDVLFGTEKKGVETLKGYIAAPGLAVVAPHVPDASEQCYMVTHIYSGRGWGQMAFGNPVLAAQFLVAISKEINWDTADLKALKLLYMPHASRIAAIREVFLRMDGDWWEKREAE